ncbi:Zn(2)-C6 fungal-type DNA-binding domain protein [Fusarium subglutinans]|uniref:Zn(2)-C6 fungal-type DNA-binding domain protein n=1 Tax=Gibberella subglutinans TaxID=42677 RepID=A0A8H5PTB1_GIBSU|nr:Zn(2)-C6 fungal-type DNA-binding domain protein [Fusarium subglutinans]KAF5602077.1 Zn(2)-C6 fungal-type DNA-binding domain protein [Fusarium subglutinans]
MDTAGSVVSNVTRHGPRTSTGRTCDGYEEAAAAEQVLQQQPPIQTVSAGYRNSQEARSIQFFIERTLSQLTSFFPDEFWGISVLQVAQYEPSISHALVSFSAYHEAFTNGNTGDKSPFALKHYNLSIKELHASQSSLSHVHLILQGHTETAIRLFKHGHRMMSQFRQATGLNGILNHVQTLFNRLALQVAILVGDVMPQLSLKCASGSQFMMANTNYTFSSLLEAREALNAILALRLIEAVANSVIVAEFSQWSQAFDKFVTSRGGLPFSPSEQRSFALIDLHRRYFNMVLPWENIDNHQGFLGLDNYTRDFEELVDCASRVLGLEATDTVSQAAPLFHLEIGVVPVLFVIVAWCRDPGIRRRAISLLMSRQAQEGVWSSHLTGRVARRIMEAEEEKLDVRSSRDVPGPRRVRSVYVSLGPGERQAMIRYEQQDREWEEAIGW